MNKPPLTEFSANLVYGSRATHRHGRRHFMSYHRIGQDRHQVQATPVQIIACPRCEARFFFSRSPDPFIDACGFESYALECRECAAPLAGIVDPLDDTLLISALAA
jgi:hypothetical protein